MHILIRAFITGFGLRLGAEAAKTIVKRLEGAGKSSKRAPTAEEAAEDDELGSTTPDPPAV